MSKEQKIVFRNGSSIECLPTGETVRGHRAEVPFIECEPTLIIPDALLNKVLEPFMTSKREDRE